MLTARGDALADYFGTFADLNELAAVSFGVEFTKRMRVLALVNARNGDDWLTTSAC